MIGTHYDKTASVERLTAVGPSTVKKAYTAHIASLPCHIQLLTDRATEDLPGSYGYDYVMFCADADIDEGDKVIIDAKRYRVMGVDKLTFKGVNKHLEVTLRIF